MVFVTLLSCVAAAAPCAEPASRMFDDAALGALLERIRDINNLLQRGLEESTGELQQRLPGLWHDLAALEEKMQRKLPLLRERLEALERELREWSPPPPRAAPGAGLIEV